MFGLHYQLNGLEFEQTPGDSKGQESLAYCSPQSCKKSDMTQRPINNGSPSRFVTIARLNVDTSKFSLIAYRVNRGNRKEEKRYILLQLEKWVFDFLGKCFSKLSTKAQPSRTGESSCILCVNVQSKCNFASSIMCYFEIHLLQSTICMLD